MFITFEGPEGAGKTTQIKLLARRLSDSGFTVCTTRQPGGTPLGQALRAILLDQRILKIDPMAEVMMMMADRAQCVSTVIRPALDRGEIVACDRYTDSSAAYQGYGRGIDLSTIAQLNLIATGDLRPDLSILLDIEPEIGLSRQTHRNRMEAEQLDFHRRVRDGYHRIARSDPDRFAIIDADRPIEDVSNAIWEAYEAHNRDRT